MIPVSNELELLSQQINLAHRPLFGGIARRDLNEIGHPMLLTILQSCADSAPDGQCHAQRELAELLPYLAGCGGKLTEITGKGKDISGGSADETRGATVYCLPQGQQAVIGCQGL